MLIKDLDIVFLHVCCCLKNGGERKIFYNLASEIYSEAFSKLMVAIEFAIRVRSSKSVINWL